MANQAGGMLGNVGNAGTVQEGLYGVVWYGMESYSTVWYGMVWNHTVGYGMVRYGREPYRMVCPMPHSYVGLTDGD